MMKDDKDFAPVPDGEQINDDTMKNLSDNKGDEE